MTTEDDIRNKLMKGATVEQLINGENYKKSTVYKVRKMLLSDKVPAPQNDFFIEDIKFNGQFPEQFRGDPRGRLNVTGTVRNVGLVDLYVTQLGIMPEWLEKENMWYSNDETFLLKPNQIKNFAFAIEVEGIDYGEYAIKFGITGQWLTRGPQTASQYSPTVNIAQTMWTDPVIMHIKRKPTGYSVFISHSINDMTLVRHIENFLDINGIRPIIAEDISKPGSYLPQKFKQLIDESSVFLVLLTSNGVRSQWVMKECEYAFQIQKVIIPIKEHSVSVIGSWFPSDVEWIEFSMGDTANILVEKISNGISNAFNKARQVANPPFLGGLLIGGLIGGLLALIFARR